ncbi:hypothetical protein [Agrococcus beijingensis]|uniref:hypothetical protein n=1 Tax=Agrococcus beijingensis TaxID=3068634 RepID=UPI002740D26B|nr:hypothetical protein [Agrococcus sp. REN33]
MPPVEGIPEVEPAAAEPDLALAAPVPAAPIESALEQASVAPLADSLIAPQVAPVGAGVTGAYQPDFDSDDPLDWYSSGSPAEATEIFSFTSSYTQTGTSFVLGATWTRPSATGAKGWSIEYTVAPERWGAAKGTVLVPQPDRSQGGMVIIINNDNGQNYTTQRCLYTSLANYPGTCVTVPNVLTSLDGGFTMQLSLTLDPTLVGQQGCPSTLGSTGYIRSWTGNRQVQAWVAPVSVDPPSNCGSISITKAADVAAASSYDFAYTLDRTGTGPVVAPSTSVINGTLKIGETDTVVTVPAGADFTLVEAAIPSTVPWAHLSTVCTVPGQAPFVLTSAASTFPVVARQTTSCVITNTTSMLTVTKIAIGQQDQAFGFDLTADGLSDLSLVGTSAPGTTSTAMLYKPNTAVTVAELLADVNAGNGDDADWTLRSISGGTVDLAARSTVVTTVAGQAVDVTFTNIQNASVVVHKQWMVDGVAYAHGQQPDGLDASLTLTGPGAAAATDQGWSVPRAGFVVGGTVVIRETTMIDPLMVGCSVTASTITDPSGRTVPLPVTDGFLLTQGQQAFTVTNTVDCDTELTLRKVVEGGAADPRDFTLTAQAPSSTLTGATGDAAITGASVIADAIYALSENGGPAVYVQSGQWVCAVLDANGAAVEGSGWTDTADASVAVPLGRHVGCTVTNATAQLTLLKVIEGVSILTPSMFDLTAAPASLAGLTAVTREGATDASAINTFDVRPGHDYLLSETSDDVDLAYVGLRLEQLVEGVWVEVDDPAAAIQVPIGEHHTYRFVNAAPTPFALPLTGGIGSDLFGYGGGSLLLLAMLAAVVVLLRSARDSARLRAEHA